LVEKAGSVIAEQLGLVENLFKAGIYMCVCGEQEEDLRDQKNVLVHEKRQ
jgi:hypothetical protein